MQREHQGVRALLSRRLLVSGTMACMLPTDCRFARQRTRCVQQRTCSGGEGVALERQAQQSFCVQVIGRAGLHRGTECWVAWWDVLGCMVGRSHWTCWVAWWDGGRAAGRARWGPTCARRCMMPGASVWCALARAKWHLQLLDAVLDVQAALSSCGPGCAVLMRTRLRCPHADQAALSSCGPGCAVLMQTRLRCPHADQAALSSCGPGNTLVGCVALWGALMGGCRVACAKGCHTAQNKQPLVRPGMLPFLPACDSAVERDLPCPPSVLHEV